MNAGEAKDEPLQVRIGVIGKGASGKTVMHLAIQKLVLSTRLEDGFELDTPDEEGLKELIRSVNKAEQKVSTSLLPRSTTAGDFCYCVYRAEHTYLKFIYHDAIGQLLSVVNDGQPNKDENYAFKSRLFEADVIWAYLPIADSGERARFIEYDAAVVKSYLRSVLKERHPDSRLSVAVVLTKADRTANMQGSMEGAATRLENLMEHARDVFSSIILSDKIASAAVFPVSAFGWNNAQELEGVNDSAIVNEKLEPWNVDALLFWSLSCAVQQPGQPTRVRTKMQLDATAMLQPALASSLEKLDNQGTRIRVIKGGRE